MDSSKWNAGKPVHPARCGEECVEELVPILHREALDGLAFLLSHILAQKLSFLPFFGAMPKRTGS
jgi:hypothetical protein